MREEKDRACCDLMLQGLVRALHHTAWSFRVQAIKDFKPLWPRPLPQDGSVPIFVKVDGSMDLAALSKLPGKLGKIWLEELGACSSLLQLLKCAAIKPELGGLYKQVLWHVGQRLDTTMQSLSKGSCKLPMLSLAAVDIEDCFMEPSKLDTQLVRYVESGVRATEGCLHLGVTSDGASVGGLTLQATIWTTTRNAAIVSVPGATPPCVLCDWRGLAPPVSRAPLCRSEPQILRWRGP